MPHATPESRTQSGFFALPSTRMGRTALLLFAILFALVVVNSAILMPYTESRVGLDTLQQIYNFALGLLLIALAVIGGVSVIRHHERSWTVLLPVAFALIALGLQIFEHFE